MSCVSLWLSCSPECSKNTTFTSSISSHLSIKKSTAGGNLESPGRGKLFPGCNKTRRQHMYRAHCSSQVPTSISSDPFHGISKISDSGCLGTLVLADLDPGSAKLAIGFLGPFLSGFGFLFILRIVMSWYPKLPVEKFPYVIAYAPTEPLLVQTRKLIPPLGGVDVTPVVWFGLLSFLNEILVGPQGILVLLSQKV
ncbi:protein COFACTOR ASSEMBLY OF COMPLEX C SUBUNIT B CCB3, chloroplastic [Sesamum angolense]|uniref:Protein COFACTOR ASSEMBLY OF COMPLEX C SUBUNIT B CCB3, chloroplastic n=1 Tax=Sesamum angolense TaxID=2727404 RepID=A0AAE1WJK5_9LAMI|nr:protein COFACTOR ASSEMBLY OF COMPLEX C SUBUNIT B CCB3, chloroplastic [Sesamum angolense]